jgi:hypothetical protein
MYPTVPIALFGWIPVILLLFALLPARRAVLTAYILGWLFLPVASFKIPGIPEYSKVTATGIGVLLGILIFDSRRLLTFRPRFIDLPIAVWCLCSYASSMTNGLGAYDATSATFNKILLWGVPYFIGRLYLTDLQALRETAITIFAGGLLYVPFCLYEIKMSPQLHRMVYGYFQDDFSETIRFSGYRPTVFMQHGLMVAMWMATSSLAGLWLWQNKSLKRLWGMPVAPLVATLLITTILCKSVNALILLFLGVAVLYFTRWFRIRIFIYALIAIAPLYLFGRINGLMDGKSLVSISNDLVGKERSESLKFRLDNEDLLLSKSLQKPVFGWAGWNRYRIEDEDGNIQGITDGFWIIAIGENGLVGLTAATTALLLPSLLLTFRLRPRDWDHPAASAAAALAIVAVLHMIDNLPNGMFNPIYILCVGGLSSLRKRSITNELTDWDYDHEYVEPISYQPAYDDLLLPTP